ncbi:MAG: hypothetical protein ACPG7F_08405 [Aggregatilineales bacterium]
MYQTITRISHIRVALVFGGVVFLLTIMGALLISNVYSDSQARNLIEAMAPSARTLCFAIITAVATINSLMLTTLSFSHQLDNEFKHHFYHQLRLIAFIGAIALILSVIVLLMLTIPLTESEALREWFTVAYYLLVGGVAGVAGLTIVLIVMLYRTLSHLIKIVMPDLDD